MLNRFFSIIYRLILLLAILLVADVPSFTDKRMSEEEEEGSIPKRDRMDLAMQQEVEITKDLSTGTVPRERLLLALNYTIDLQNRQRAMRMQAAIPGVVWTERGPNNVGGRTRTILVDPNDATKKSVFAGSVGGGVWKTTDITAATPVWTPVNDLFSNISVTTIAADPLNAQTIYFGTGEGFYNADAIRGLGIWKSTNGGSTFAQLASTNVTNFNYVNKLVVHPATSHIFSATRNGLFKSKDGGVSWTKVLGSGVGASFNNMSDVEIASDGSVWVGAGMSGADGVYRAPAAGATTGDAGTYTKMNTGANGFPTTGFDRVELACAPNNASVVYVLLESSSTSDLFGVYKTTDAGTSWTSMATPTDADGGVTPGFTRTQAWYDLSIAVDPNNANTLFIGGVDVFKSTDGASTWNQITHWYGGFGFQDVHADQHTVVFEPGSSSTVYFGNDGGIFRTTNGSSSMPTLTSKNLSYNVTQFYGCAMHPTAYSNYFLAGAQDNGSHQFNTTGVNSTVEVTGGDGCFCHIDQDQPNFQFTSYVYNNYYRSTNGGASWTSVSFGNTGSFVNPTDYDNASNVMYGGISAGNYMRWTDPQTGSTTATINITSFGGSSIRHVSVSPNTPNRVFFGISNGRVVLVDNANTIATGSTGVLVGNPASGSVSCIAIEPGNDNHILVTYSNYGMISVYECINALAATPTFSNVEGNLPDMPVRWALFNPSNNKQAMLATETGVWTTDLLNGTSTVWGPSNTGLANTRVDMLQIRSSDFLVAAATHGRGLFTSDAFVVTPYPDFNATPKIIYTNKPVQFSDGSYKSTSWSWDFGDATTSTSKNPSKSYAAPGLYTVTLTINGNSAYSRTKTSYIQVLPDRGTPYTVAGGAAGSFDFNPIEFGSELINGTTFERGNSAVAGKNGVVSGGSAWVTSLTSANYTNNSTSYLYCPNYNLTAAGTYTLSFYGKWAFESNYDGFNVEYSLNKGTSWTVLGTNGAGWYGFANAAGGTAFPATVPFFTGTVGTYTKYSKDISFLAGNTNVAFRFVFKSDPSVTAAGVALDNFEITGASNSPLPVSLLTFTGEANGDHNQLKWSTASEINNSRFEIERSADGLIFNSVGEVGGNGSTTALHDYHFKDYDLSRPYFYYRLKQIDFDGVFAYSPIIFIRSNLSVSKPYVLTPNPFTDKFYVLLKTKNPVRLQVELYTASGKLVYSKTNQDAIDAIPIQPGELTNGIYFVSLRINDDVYSEKIIFGK